MNSQRKSLRRFIGALSLVTLASLSQVQVSNATGSIGKADLVGTWTMTLTGDTGCGVSTAHVTFTLNAAGTGSVTNQGHTSGCSNAVVSGNPFTIVTLNANGTGTANLSCGVGCGWDFQIQVSPDRSMFSLVDVTNGGNYLEGIAIHQS